MSDLSRRAMLRAIPSVATVTVVPVAAASGPLADAAILALAARVAVLAKESDAADADLNARDDMLTEQEPPRPFKLYRGDKKFIEDSSTDELRRTVADLQPTDVVFRHYADRLARMEAWDAEVAAISDRLGIPAAVTRNNKINGELVPAIEQLTAMVPVTLGGIGAKADAVHAAASWVDSREHKALSASVLADVRRLAGGAHVG